VDDCEEWQERVTGVPAPPGHDRVILALEQEPRFSLPTFFGPRLNAEHYIHNATTVAIAQDG